MKRSILLTASFLIFGMMTACGNNCNTKNTDTTDNQDVVTKTATEETATVIELTSDDYTSL